MGFTGGKHGKESKTERDDNAKRKSYYISDGEGNWTLIPKEDHAKYGITNETKKTSD